MEYIFEYDKNNEPKAETILGDDITFVIRKETITNFRIVFSEFQTDYNEVVTGKLSAIYEILKQDGVTNLNIKLKENAEKAPYIIFSTSTPIVGIEVRQINDTGDKSENRTVEDNLKIEMFIG